MLEVSKSAIQPLIRLLAEKAKADSDGLRLSVERGGCAGLQYAMQVGPAQPDDHVVHDEDGARVFVAADSTDFLRGSVLDYKDSLSDAGFRIENPNAQRSCGCGTSFEPTEPETAASAAPSLPQGEDPENCSGES